MWTGIQHSSQENAPCSLRPLERGFLKAGEIFGGRTNAGVVQDKQPPGRLTTASVEPATAEIPAVGGKGGSATALDTSTEYKVETQSAVDHPTHHGSETRRTEQVTGRVLPVLKAQLLKVAKQRGAKNESTAVKMAVEVFVANEFGKQFLVMIRQTIQETVRQEFQAYTNRFGKLTFSAYLAAEQGRLLHIKHLRATLQPKDIGDIPQMIKNARGEAWDNLTFYNYSLKDIEKAVSETVPWQ
jgi:hypothetical protein